MVFNLKFLPDKRPWHSLAVEISTQHCDTNIISQMLTTFHHICWRQVVMRWKKILRMQWPKLGIPSSGGTVLRFSIAIWSWSPCLRANFNSLQRVGGKTMRRVEKFKHSEKHPVEFGERYRIFTAEEKHLRLHFRTNEENQDAYLSSFLAVRCYLFEGDD